MSNYLNKRYRSAGLILFMLLMVVISYGQPGSRRTFNNDWQFYLGQTDESVHHATFKGEGWRNLSVPHDWSIELPFDKESPTGTGGGALRGGLGWYRKVFVLPEADKHKKHFIRFDGVYMNSEVYLNGHLLGVRPNGYIGFSYDMSPYLQYGQQKNILVVKVNNDKQPNSRWYSGSGIYRNVWLESSSGIRISEWGPYITTPGIRAGKAVIKIETPVHIDKPAGAIYRLRQRLFDAKGVQLLQSQNKFRATETTVNLQQELTVTRPVLWSDENPYLYKIVSEVIDDNNKIMDSYTTRTGIRSFYFDADKGFFLNGKATKLRGVCMHHDLGALGTAINTRAIERQLEILKAMGCNSIRTSHNPPAPELLDLCDKMGFLVMDEAFDMWAKKKTDYDYHLYWDQWHERDLRDHVLRDRNHPSVIMWSVGNEIIEQWGKDSSGAVILDKLVNIVKELDDRPAITANNEINTYNNLLKANITPLIGYNYSHKYWDSVHSRWGKKPFIVTESTSALQTRGSYDMPSDSIRRWPEAWDKPLTTGNTDTTCSAYDNCATPWGSTHEESLKLFQKYDHIGGMYVWTGFDYIGEPTPYPWPARSSYFGIVDLAGFPKDVYYLYQSTWTSQPVLHIFPHWNWTPGQTVDVWAYYNQADEVELYLNGQSLGIRKKQNDAMHVVWRVSYRPGILKAVSRKNGKIIKEALIQTAGEPAAISLSADRKQLQKNKNDLSFITVTIKDKKGNTVPLADNLVTFTLQGDAEIVGVDNGSQTSMESFKALHRKAFHGKCLVIVKAKNKTGLIKLTASAAGLPPATIELQVQ
ncbi:glycoside hydrolase family 2 TIM barrel-domain containing protein [Terrimonas rubra]|uniref:Glycoside hydrolase family 2 TIM barrel-domain containing protein n=1 Tax=Terrimonas rubra TaxID=1035890 RepID=A0ABW6A4L4_9BACT